MVFGFPNFSVTDRRIPSARITPTNGQAHIAPDEAGTRIQLPIPIAVKETRLDEVLYKKICSKVINQAGILFADKFEQLEHPFQRK